MVSTSDIAIAFSSDPQDLEEIAIRDAPSEPLIDIQESDDLEKHKFNLCAWMFIYIFGLATVATLIILLAYYLWK